MLRTADAFEEGCDVAKVGDVVDCGRCPGTACHVKDATAVFNRMGDMGKLPTSAWLRLWKDGGVREVLAEVCREEASPSKRAALLVERFARVHRVGRKLATMFVSALSTPALAPGLTPWFPDIDGNDLVVVDTNVARAVDALREPGAAKTYDARERWVREQAAQLDLREFRPDLPICSPRLVQQALYAFCSKSNRVARGTLARDAQLRARAARPRCAPSRRRWRPPVRWPVKRQRLRPAKTGSAVKRSRFLSPRGPEERARTPSRTPSARAPSRPRRSLRERCPRARGARRAPEVAETWGRNATAPEIALRGRC